MDLTSENLQDLNKGFKSLYDASFGEAKNEYERIAMHVNSETAEEAYGWMGSISSIREWIGERVINALKTHDFAIKNKDWEDTIAIAKNAVKDNKYGTYAPLFSDMGKAVKMHPDDQVFSLLANAFTTLCFDGQFLVDTDHPVLDANGVMQSVSNSGGGSGAPWFLIDDTRAIKPFIYQEREKFNFVAYDNPDDPNVFYKKEFVYGIDGRNATGTGLWQLIYGSKQTLDTANFNAAFTAMTSLKGDNGKPLRIKPTLLVVGPSNREAANKIVKAEQVEGTTNTNRGTVEVLVSPYLT